MQKKLITLAVAGILAAPMMAQAAVEVYGQARVSVGSISNDDATVGADKSKISVANHASRLGFKGNEDLGGGLKAVYQIERGIDFTDSGTLSTKNGTDLSVRNTFIGLAGGFGTVVLGTHDTPYKIATGNLDPFVDTYADYNAVIDSTHDVRLSNVIAYISPDMGGFTLAAAYVPDVVDDQLADTTTNALTTPTSKKSQEALSLAGMYKNGPLFVSVAYQNVAETGGLASATATKNDDLTAMKFGVGYTINQFDLGLVYENTDGWQDANNSTGTTQVGDQTNIYLTASMNLGSDQKVKFAYGTKDDIGSTATANGSEGSDFFALGYSKNMSANVELYALYASMGTDKGIAGRSLNGVGTGTATAGGDNNASALAVGMNMKFSSM